MEGLLISLEKQGLAAQLFRSEGGIARPDAKKGGDLALSSPWNLRSQAAMAR
jgi:hypothetical protein